MSTVLELVGLILIVVGTCLMSVPVGLVAAGGAFVLVGWLTED